jgi:acyl-CoA synthetase (AMP-forming)/AMP-acid ligase II
MSATTIVNASLAELPQARAAAEPDAPALGDDAVTLDNAAFADRVARAAALLDRLGVRSGDVVAIAMPNRVELIIALFAAWRLGAAATPVNPTLTPTEMQYQLDDADAKVVIGDGLDVDATVVDVDALAAEQSAYPGGADARPDSLALLIYTSGTTGKPKGVMLDHANIAAMCDMTRAGLGITAVDHSLLILPLFHVNGIVVGTLTPLLAGGRVTVAGRFSPKTFFGLVERIRPTYLSAVPAIYAMLTSMPEAETADTSSLRLVVCGAAPMHAQLIGRVEAVLGVALVEGYGLSEGSCASTLNPYDGLRKPGTVGLPLPGQEVRVVDQFGNPVPQGERGEIVIRGANVMRGYLNRPDDTAKTIVDGWLHTGDVGIYDEDGYLRIVDRIKDMIIRGGENIYPKEIETVLYSHDGVHEAAVVGQANDVLGEVVIAYVSVRPGAAVTVEELEVLCDERLAKYKRPVAIHILDELPKNHVGKIDKPALRDLASRQPR